MKKTDEKTKSKATSLSAWIGDDLLCKEKDATPEERLQAYIQDIGMAYTKIESYLRQVTRLNKSITLSIINAAYELKKQGVPKDQRTDRIAELLKGKSEPSPPKKLLTKGEEEWIEFLGWKKANYIETLNRKITELLDSDIKMDMFV